MRSVRNIYAGWVNCVIDLGCCRLPLVLVLSSIWPEGCFGCTTIFQLSVTYDVRFHMCLYWYCVHVTKHCLRFHGIERCLGPAYCVKGSEALGVRSVCLNQQRGNITQRRMSPTTTCNIWGFKLAWYLPLEEIAGEHQPIINPTTSSKFSAFSQLQESTMESKETVYNTRTK